ncbi:DUF2867 domain-containing protein [uncultured Alistipes sp.]|jgi:hypothetical protein|uniref:DUF2867 domain-containing protein n=1 Tax=uncultured Alistipes sp. TaxID=538949 RepID=UPI0025E44CD1|nr:DUF2867 domain-containing protein [uncultured Alistipes sp.]
MKIRKTALPANSRIATYLPYDFCDSFLFTAGKKITLSPDDLMVAFWATNPAWLRTLYKIRAMLVKPFGLKTGKDSDQHLMEQAIRSGASYRLMSVVEKTGSETIISLDDKHLRAYLSVYIEDRNIQVSTLVRYHNKLGVAYFNLIRPFHTIVVRKIFKQVLKERGIDAAIK